MSASRLPPPPPPPPVMSPWRPPAKKGLGGFWDRRSTKGKAGIIAAGIFAAAVLVTPGPTPAPSQPADPVPAAVGQADVATTASPTLRPTATALVVTPPPTTPPPTTPAPSPIPTLSPTPAPSPTPTPRPTPRFIVVSDLVNIESSRAVFRGTTGTYTWSDVSISPYELRVAWDAKAGNTACRIRWALEPEDDDLVAKTVRVASGDRVTGARRIDTSSITGAALTVTSTCPTWQLTMKEAPEPTPKPAARASNCHPSYTGECLKQGAGDYDCAGGSGNGPNYVYGTVRVVGWDEFDLDRDNDGYGCE